MLAFIDALSIATINGVSAFVACIVLWRTSRLVGNSLRWMLKASSVLAFWYSAAYFWLAFNLELVGDWSSVMQWFGLFAWPLVWIAVPVTMIHWANHRGNTLVSGAQTLVDKFDPERRES